MNGAIPSGTRPVHVARPVRILTAALLLGAPAKVCASEPVDPADRHRVRVDLRACEAVSQAEVRRILGIEIGDLLLDANEVPPPDSDHLTIACQGGLARLEASTAAGGPSRGRLLYLDAFPSDAVPRALALAAIEVLAAFSPAVRTRLEHREDPPAPSRLEPASGQPAQPGPTPGQPGPTPGPPQPARDPTKLTRISAEPGTAARAHPNATSDRNGDYGRGAIGMAGVWRTYSGPQGSTAWGGRIGLNGQRGPWLGAGIDVEVVGARTRVPQGEIGSLLLSSGGFWRCRHIWGETPVLSVSAGLGGRIGLARLVGDPAGRTDVVGKDVVRAWGGPAASASLRASIGSWGLELAAEAGFALLSAEAQADRQPAPSVRGGWVALSLGASVGY